MLRAAESGEKFTDQTFLWPYSIHWPELPALWGDASYDIDYVIQGWTRISDAFWDGDYSMWGHKGIRPADSIQGEWIGNCWLISAAIALAEVPERLKRAFLIEEKNTASVYALRMYALGAPITITIDDHLPLISDQETVYAAVSDDGALWGPVLEKAYAKYIGNYEALNGGYIGPGIETIVGSPWQDLWHDGGTVTADWMWKVITEHRKHNGMVTGGSHYSADGDVAKNDQGISYSHAYTLLYTVELSTGDRLVAVANPWG